MNCLSEPRWSVSSPWFAVVAWLAMLASPVRAEDGAALPYRVKPSRYAAKQVRVPAEPSRVQPASHTMPRGGATYRTAMKSRAAMQVDHSVMVQEGDVIMEGSPMGEAIPTPHGDVIQHDNTFHTMGALQGGGCADGSCGGSDCGCGPRNCNSCGTCCLIPCPNFRFDKFEFFAGADAFSGPLNLGEGGSFGFHEGVNWGSNLPCQDLLSAQAGFRAVQSTFNGNDITEEDRRQFFVTAGLFRRVDWGLQGGAVVDLLHDEWYYEPLDLIQVRGELSWVFPCHHELGFWFTQGINGGTTTSEVAVSPTASITVTEGWHSTDLYAFFYRKHFDDCNAYGRIFGGFTGESDGLVGADFNVPLCERLALRTDFTYLIPNQSQSLTGNEEESWNVSIGLVFYPGCRTARSHDYNRPLLNVANNGSFMVDRD